MNYAKDITSDYTASYAKYVATSRSVPSLVDGLKPVARRCINSADDLKLYHDKKFLKVAKLEGQVMGDYHPHGGASMTILAQPFKTRYPLFEGQGNFGSPDQPNSVAASRYIETRLTKFCEDFYLSSADYADRADNYDGRLKEVVRYYPPIPGVLLTGSSGIAVGLSTNIPPHTITDVCESLLSYIEHPDKSDYLENIMPETCEDSIILTPKSDIKDIYRRGEGSVQYKAKTHYESIDGKLALVVDAFPPDYSKKRLETSFILDAVESGNLELRNESSTGIRYVFLSNDKEVLSAVEERLVSSSGYRFYIEHDDKIHMYNLAEIYDDFIEARTTYIRRKYTDLVMKSEEEIKFIDILLEFKKDREYIKSMFDKPRDEVIEDIMSRYGAPKEVAIRIISSSLSSMLKDNTDKLILKRKELAEQITEYTGYIHVPIIKIVKDVKDLRDEYKNEVRRAVHIDEISDKIILKYKGKEIEAHPSDQFFIFDSISNKQYQIVSAADLSTQDNIDWMLLVSADYDYYVLYDEQGFVALTRETMMKMENKFKSDHLVGVIGTNDLSDIRLQKSDSKRTTILGDWALRTRLSYIKHTDKGVIRLFAQSSDS